MSEREAYVRLLKEWAPKLRLEITDMDHVIKNCKLIGEDKVEVGVYAQLYATILSARHSEINRELIFIASKAMGEVIHTALSQPDRCHDIHAMFRDEVVKEYKNGRIIKQAVDDLFIQGGEIFIQVASVFFGFDQSPMRNTGYDSIDAALKKQLH